MIAKSINVSIKPDEKDHSWSYLGIALNGDSSDKGLCLGIVDEVLLELVNCFFVKTSLLVFGLLVECFPDSGKAVLELGFLQDGDLSLAQFLTK